MAFLVIDDSCHDIVNFTKTAGLMLPGSCFRFHLKWICACQVEIGESAKKVHKALAAVPWQTLSSEIDEANGMFGFSRAPQSNPTAVQSNSNDAHSLMTRLKRHE